MNCVTLLLFVCDHRNVVFKNGLWTDMAIFDELRHLSTFLYDAHASGRHSLSDLYELVQYAANIIPRLYLMITVGSVYMRVSVEAYAGKGKTPQDTVEDMPPIKELMRDMLEMTRGVQHPTRGLFLRYYLSGLTRDYLPTSIADGPHGTITDSIYFILQNFVEMNKLWVRLQHQGLSRERDLREQERRDLRLLVGSNLVRLSQLDELGLTVYQQNILPKILEEIVSCRDVIAQEYLMEVIIQVFQDDFHLRTLESFLSATAQLQRAVNVKQIVISLVDRFASFAARAREEEQSKKDSDAPVSSGIPEDVHLFDVFWAQITELINARPEFTIQDIVALLLSLANLSLNCYPERLSYVDTVLGKVKEKLLEARMDPECKDVLEAPKTKSLLKDLLMAPIYAYSKNVLKVLNFPSSATNKAFFNAAGPKSESLGGNYTDILFLQSFAVRREIGHVFATHVLRAALLDDIYVDSPEAVHFLLGEVCSVMIRDQFDGGLFGPKKPVVSTEEEDDEQLKTRQSMVIEPELVVDWEDMHEEQTLVAKLIHVVRNNDIETELQLLTTARNHLGEGGDLRIRFTLPPLVICLLKLARKFHNDAARRNSPYPDQILKFVMETIISLGAVEEPYTDQDGNKPLFSDDPVLPPIPSPSKLKKNLMSPHDVSLCLFLMGGQICDEMGQEEACYEFFVQALSVYEDAISDTKAQVNAITQIIGTLCGTTVFGYENYETLITKCAVHCSRLLKRVDQSRGVLLVSHLFMADNTKQREEGKPAYRDPKRVLECLQKSLKIADSVRDHAVNVELFVEILERYIFYYDERIDTITFNFINQLVHLIRINLNASETQREASPTVLGGPLSAATNASSSIFSKRSRKVSENTIQHFQNILAYIRSKKEEERVALDGSLVGVSGFGANHSGRWGDIESSSTK